MCVCACACVCVYAMLCYAKSLQSCPTLCDPIDGSPPGSAVPEILQARTLERVAMSFSNAWKWKVKVKSLSRVRLLATPWTAAYQAPLSMDSPGKNTGVGCRCLQPWAKSCYGTFPGAQFASTPPLSMSVVFPRTPPPHLLSWLPLPITTLCWLSINFS